MFGATQASPSKIYEALTAPTNDKASRHRHSTGHLTDIQAVKCLDLYEQIQHDSATLSDKETPMQNLLRAIKGNGETQAQPETVVKEPAKKSLSEISLVEKITESLTSGSPRGFRPGIHPSEVSHEDPFCPRWHIYREQLVKAQQQNEPFPFGVKFDDVPPIEPSLLRIFQMGHSVHSMYQDDFLGQAGVLYGTWKRWDDKKEKWEIDRGFRPEGRGWKYEEPRIRTKGVTGQCDGILFLDGRWFVLEIKSSNDQAFRFRKKVKHEHLRQAQIYANLGFVDFPEVEPEGIVFLYVNKNTSEEKEFIVPRDTKMIEDVLQGLDTYARAVKTKSLPPRQCVRLNCKRANACPVKAHCFKTPAGEAGYLKVTEG